MKFPSQRLLLGFHWPWRATWADGADINGLETNLMKHNRLQAMSFDFDGSLVILDPFALQWSYSSSSRFNISSGETHLKRRRVLGERKVHRSWVGKLRVGNERVDVLRRARAVGRRRGLCRAAAVLPLLKGEFEISAGLQNVQAFPPEVLRDGCQVGV